ncbi:MAG TPA: glucose 1-dehydrogenase [Dehalococcoidia bacterium]|nr:glucose 1-dehydrogenase [Dehalococcoidia bacterium]HIL30305.1 glucose 1-dehydrogenase [Dehalococcoidia bacterium]
MRLENKVALVSGGARGIGAAITKILAHEGAKVVIGDVLVDAGQKTAAEINDAGGECVFVQLDVTSEAAWNSAVGEAVSRFGKLDILVNNAGVTSRGMIEDISVDDWTRVMDVNVKGGFLGTKASIPLMRANGGGSIVNISSGAAIAPQPNTSGAYSASKGAVRIFTKSTAIQYAGENIRCNSVHPGPVETDMLNLSREDDTELATMKARVPLGRFGSAEDIAYGVLYLASDESSFVTGSELVIDGGRTAQ